METKNISTIFPSFEIIPLCTCGRENHKYIMNKFFISEFEDFLAKFNVSKELKNIALDDIVQDVDALPFCCKLRACFGAVYSIPVSLSSRIDSQVERKQILSLPGPMESMGLFSWAHKPGFTYINGVVSIDQ